MKTIGLFFLHLLFFPIFLAIDIAQSKLHLALKILLILTLVPLFLINWKSLYQNSERLYANTLYQTGLTDRLIDVPVAGDSMLPNISDGTNLTLHNPNKFTIDRGDIVSFRNQVTWPRSLIKRVVGLPQDKILIKDGTVYINGQLIQENYVFDNLPTFGHEFIRDCQTYTVPDGHYFVMGDNRLVSFDSRALGFINKSDITGIIKSNTKPIFSPEFPFQDNSRPVLNQQNLISLFNQIRAQYSLYPLTFNPQLQQIASTRAQAIAQNFDNWKQLSLSLQELANQANLDYSQLAEFVTYGFLSEQNITDQIEGTPEVFLDLFSNTYTDFGLALQNITNGDCQLQAIVIIIGRPQQPTYQNETINYWQSQEQQSKKILADLNSFKGYPSLDQQEYDRLLTVVNEAYTIAAEINRQIKNGIWIDETLVERYDKIVFQNNAKIDEFFEQALTTSKANIGQTDHKDRLNCDFFGLKTLETDTAGKIIDVWQEDDRIKITVAFSNPLGISSGTLAPYMLALSNKDGQAMNFPDPAVASLTIKPGETIVYDFSYKELPDPPYTFIYHASNTTIELAKCFQ